MKMRLTKAAFCVFKQQQQFRAVAARRFMSAAANSSSPFTSSFPRPTIGTNVPLAMESLVASDAVCFDVDSTVVNEEGIDVLADFLGKGKEVAELTRNAMGGSMKFQDALQVRLDLLQPSKDQIEQCLIERPLQLTEGILELVQKLKKANKHVYLVSGGFRIMIEPVAKLLEIPKSNIIANRILFDNGNKYAGFDPNEPTSRDMGKPRALELIRDRNAYKNIVMIGDGATDMQAKPPAVAFIGFGGVEVREKVRDGADWFVTDFADLIYILDEHCKRNQL